MAIAQGFVKIAKSLFPPNPTELASGLAMVSAGKQLASLGGGGSGGGGGGGGGSASGLAQTQSEAIDAPKDKVTVILPPVISTTDPNIRTGSRA